MIKQKNRPVRIRKRLLPQIDFVRIRSEAKVPTRATRDSAGYDLSSAESLTIKAHCRALIHTGVSVRIPKRYHIEIRPRSGLALRHGITVLNTPGTIDADYRGELMVVLFNTSDEDYAIEPGDRIAQAVVIRHADVVWRELDDFDDAEASERGDRGFGSTGMR